MLSRNNEGKMDGTSKTSSTEERSSMGPVKYTYKSFERQKQIAKNGNSVVSKCLMLTTEYVVKEIPGGADDGLAALQAEKEAAEMCRHPNCITTFAIVKTGKDQHGLLMEPMSCTAAETALGSKANLTDVQRVDLCVQGARGMQAIHMAGFMHCDIKLDNMLVHRGKNGSIVLKISDFGLAVL